ASILNLSRLSRSMSAVCIRCGFFFSNCLKFFSARCSNQFSRFLYKSFINALINRPTFLPMVVVFLSSSVVLFFSLSFLFFFLFFLFLFFFLYFFLFIFI